MQGKVEIAGVNTAKLKVLKSSETMELLRRRRWPQAMQCDGVFTNSSPRGRRKISTLQKLPTHRPSAVQSSSKRQVMERFSFSVRSGVSPSRPGDRDAGREDETI